MKADRPAEVSFCKAACAPLLPFGYLDPACCAACSETVRLKQHARSFSQVLKALQQGGAVAAEVVAEALDHAADMLGRCLGSVPRRLGLRR